MGNPISRKPNYLSLWIHLLMLANHEEDHKFIWNGKSETLKKGQFITGRLALSELSGIPQTTIERILNYLEKEQQIGQQKTTKYRLITITKWESYQNSDNKRTTNGQQTDTFKNTKKERKNTVAEQAPQENIVKVIDAFKEVNPANSRWYGHKTYREAIIRLIETYGLEQVLKVIAILPKTNKMNWITHIATPQQLEDRWSTLSDQLIKEKNKGLLNKRKIL
jgi:hypothetical protein